MEIQITWHCFCWKMKLGPWTKLECFFTTLQRKPTFPPEMWRVSTSAGNNFENPDGKKSKIVDDWTGTKLSPKTHTIPFLQQVDTQTKNFDTSNTQRGTCDLNGRSTEKWGGKRPVLKLRLEPFFGMIQLCLDLTHILLGLVWTLSSINYIVDASELRRSSSLPWDVHKTL